MAIKNKVVIITGASSGIGKATALLLAESGAKVVLAARNQEKLEKAVNEIKEKHINKLKQIKINLKMNFYMNKLVLKKTNKTKIFRLKKNN